MQFASPPMRGCAVRNIQLVLNLEAVGASAVNYVAVSDVAAASRGVPRAERLVLFQICDSVEISSLTISLGIRTAHPPDFLENSPE